MATPGQLVTKISEVLSIPEGTLTAYDRVLREAGLLTKAGRGRGSTQRTPLDTARLLIALLVTSSPARAAEAVNDFGILECSELKLRNPEALTLAALCGEEFEQTHTFEHALAAIISGFGQNNFQQALDSNAWDLDDRHSFLPHLGVTVWDTKVAAQINVAGNLYYYHHPLELRLSSLPLKFEIESIKERNALRNEYLEVSQKYRGIRTERTLMMPEIKPIAEFVMGVNPEG